MADVSGKQCSTERNQLVAELHHRLKNHLQMITAVVSLQASRTTDPRIGIALRATQNRVRAIAGVLGAQTTPDLNTVHFGDYLVYLVRELEAEYAASERVEIEIRSAEIALDMEQAVALALIANELTVNALEHAFPGGGRGTLRVDLSYAGAADDGMNGTERGVLEISDNGVDLPRDWNFGAAGSTGFFLVKTLISQLRAEISVEERENGKSFRIVFPLGDGKAADW